MEQAAKQNLIAILGIESLPDDQKVRILEQASELAQKRVLGRMLDSLSEEKQLGLMSLLDSDDQVGISTFINHNCPEFEKWLVEEITSLRSELSGLVPAA